jgi:hypothetical protein
MAHDKKDEKMINSEKKGDLAPIVPIFLSKCEIHTIFTIEIFLL